MLNIAAAEAASHLTEMADIKKTVSGLDSPMRMSDYLKNRLRFSGALITKVKFGGVSLNGEAVTMRAQVNNGDTVEITFPQESSENIEPAFVPLDIVFEDEHILVVNKPIGMPTHPSKGNHLTTLGNAVVGYYGRNFVFRAITRLDRDTSGLVLIAKNPFSAARLCVDMKSGRIKKKYSALVKGVPSIPQARIDAPIKRESEGNIKRIVADDGKRAITDYKVITTIGENAVLDIDLLTGRTHQIRVHMAYIGHPLVGDFLYGERSEDGYKLTCTELEFEHPYTGKTITFTTEPHF